MPGSNDTKEINWVSEEQFKKQYHELIATYRTGEKQPRIILCSPPDGIQITTIPGVWINDLVVDRLEMVGRCVKEVAEEAGAEFVDIYSATKGRPDIVVFDGIHPKPAMTRIIAEKLYTRILNE